MSPNLEKALIDLLSTFLPFILLIGLWVLMLRQAGRKQWLVAENGTLVNVEHVISIETRTPPDREGGTSIVATTVTGTVVVIASNLGAEEAHRRLEQIRRTSAVR